MVPSSNFRVSGVPVLLADVVKESVMPYAPRSEMDFPHGKAEQEGRTGTGAEPCHCPNHSRGKTVLDSLAVAASYHVKHCQIPCKNWLELMPRF